MIFQKVATGTTLLGFLLVISVAIHTQPDFTVAEIPILLILFSLYAFTEFFPLKRNQLTISLSLSVDLLIFVKFGIVPIVLISQVLLIVGRWQRERKFEGWKTFANVGMFMVASGGAALVFFLVGGMHKASVTENFLPLLAYVCVHYVLNHACIYVYFRSLNVYEKATFLSDLRLDFFSTLFASSLGFIVILLYEVDGLFGLLAIGFPMILCVYVFKLFNDLWRSSSLFRNLARLTGDFSAELEVNAMCYRVTEELPKWFERVDSAIFVRQEDILVPVATSKGLNLQTIQSLTQYMQDFETLVNGPTLFKRLDDHPELLEAGYKTLLVAPFHSDQTEVGYCCLLAQKSTEFDATTLDAVSILASQLSVSYRNAVKYENVEKQSLYDELTQLPNNRFLERRLSEEIMRFDGATPLSLLLIDLDHFKRINDQYGHLAGNDVLKALANTFESCIRKSDFVARYGGEEFIIVLPGASRTMALEIAEKIRASVESQHIAVQTMDGDSVILNLTVSIGTATSPYDAKDALKLIRFADRAMYHGAKRAGRNRVSAYDQETETM